MQQFMSNTQDTDNRDVTDSSLYDLNNRETFRKQMEQVNTPIIEEFRANGGKVGGPFADRTLLLLETIGAKSHQTRINPLRYIKDGDAFVVMATKGGAPTNPDWYHTILTRPEVWLEVETERFKAHATVPEREERDRLFAEFAQQEPGVIEYQKSTTRVLPVVILKRI
jgi:deazaflavin-dependent oxidoreductase (nitroreductase family)